MKNFFKWKRSFELRVVVHDPTMSIYMNAPSTGVKVKCIRIGNLFINTKCLYTHGGDKITTKKGCVRTEYESGGLFLLNSWAAYVLYCSFPSYPTPTSHPHIHTCRESRGGDIYILMHIHVIKMIDGACPTVYNLYTNCTVCKPLSRGSVRPSVSNYTGVDTRMRFSHSHSFFNSVQHPLTCWDVCLIKKVGSKDGIHTICRPLICRSCVYFIHTLTNCICHVRSS